MKMLEKLQDFLGQNMDGFDDLPLFSFEADSEAHKAATELGIPVNRIESTYQADLFTPDPHVSYELDYQRFCERTTPYDFGGPPIEPEVDGEGGFIPIAFDDQDVLIQCSRGICMISRERWNDGYRYCKGC